jgi:nucleotide-binding universal stress UspA family protein
MKKILVPTDFSTIANNALRFAIEFAAVMECEILLYHVYTLDRFNFNLDFSHEEQPIAKEKERKMMKTRQIFKDEIVEKGIAVHTKVEEDSVFSLFNQKAAHHGADIIIMGTKGATGTKGGVFGSVAVEALEIASVPVLLVPPNFKFSHLKRIILAMDHIGLEEEVVAPLKALAMRFDSEVTILNVADGNRVITKNLSMEGVKTSFKEVLLSNSINESITGFMNQEGCDLLCMVRRKKSLFDSFFKKSITRAKVLENQCPLLVLPDL